MAREAAVSRFTWINWENGKRPDPELFAEAMKRISRRWFIDMNTLMGGEMESVDSFSVPLIDRPGESVSVPRNLGFDFIQGFIMNSEGMLDLLHPRDILAVNYKAAPVLGTIVIAKHRLLGDYVVKQLYPESLHSLNPKYPDLPLDDYDVIGMVVGLVRKLEDQTTVTIALGGLRPRT